MRLNTCIAAATWALLAPAASANLIVNGAFESGFSDWSTDYSKTATGCISCIGVDDHTLFSSGGWYNAPGYVWPFGDHTTGSGLMLLYDPPPTPSVWRIWYQNVDVVDGTTYTFSGWVREANSEATPNNGRVGVYANGELLGQQDAPDGAWAQWSFQYKATTTGTIELALRDLYPTTYGGTYSAIDDLSFTAAVPEPETYALMLAGLGVIGVAGRRQRRAAGRAKAPASAACSPRSINHADGGSRR